jgi:hypothetical protein
MLRNEWKFTYTAAKLADGADAKLKFHEERIIYWKRQKDDLVAEIRKDGLEVSEGTALGYSNPKSRDYERGAKVMVRNDLKEKLDECMEKLAYHVGSKANLVSLVLVEVVNEKITRLDMCGAPSPHSARRSGEYPGRPNAVEQGLSTQPNNAAATDRQTFNRFVNDLHSGQSIEQMSPAMRQWWRDRY